MKFIEGIGMVNSRLLSRDKECTTCSTIIASGNVSVFYEISGILQNILFLFIKLYRKHLNGIYT